MACSPAALRGIPTSPVRQPGYTAVAVEVGIGLGGHSSHAPAAPAARAVPENDDTALVDALVSGEAQALERVYDRHGRGVYSLALHLLGDRALAEEVVQETFLKLWRQPAAYQSSRGRLQSWLLGIAHHHCIDLLRRRKLEQRHRAAPPLPTDGEPSPNPFETLRQTSDEANPEASTQLAEQRRTVANALGRLPAEQRMPIELAYYRGLTQVEIATQLGQPLGTIKTRMRLGLRRLRSAPGLADLRDDV